MKVSVLTVTYNHAPYIEESVLSVVNQVTSFPFELVIGEDCSTDETRTLVERLARDHSAIIRPNLQPRNLGPALNFIDTFKKCSGDYIAILDGDDYWTCPEKLEQQVQFLEHHSEFSACFHNVEIQDGEEKRLFCGPDQAEMMGLADLFQGNPIGAPSILFRNRLFKEFPPWYAACPIGDWPLHMLTAAHGQIRYFNKVMAVHRVHRGGAHNSKRKEQILSEQIATLENLKNHFGSPFEPRILREITRNHYALSLSHWMAGSRGAALNSAFKTIFSPPFFRNLDWKLKMITRIATGNLTTS